MTALTHEQRTLLHQCVDGEGWTTFNKRVEHDKVDRASSHEQLAEMIDYFYGVMGLPG